MDSDGSCGLLPWNPRTASRLCKTRHSAPLRALAPRFGAMRHCGVYLIRKTCTLYASLDVGEPHGGGQCQYTCETQIMIANPSFKWDIPKSCHHRMQSTAPLYFESKSVASVVGWISQSCYACAKKCGRKPMLKQGRSARTNHLLINS